ncbi:hypothetical protein [Bacillus marinisedimentorum]|uniref:hypothetical protein n=1 Tax=Bacillus marinisedimentorum TaxID=1821260 RepID=UPI0008724169|nr:hypothetical protein [Bacillus marinisedimentorum]
MNPAWIVYMILALIFFPPIAFVFMQVIKKLKGSSSFYGDEVNKRKPSGFSRNDPHPDEEAHITKRQGDSYFSGGNQ